MPWFFLHLNLGQNNAFNVVVFFVLNWLEQGVGWVSDLSLLIFFCSYFYPKLTKSKIWFKFSFRHLHFIRQMFDINNSYKLYNVSRCFFGLYCCVLYRGWSSWMECLWMAFFGVNTNVLGDDTVISFPLAFSFRLSPWQAVNLVFCMVVFGWLSIDWLVTSISTSEPLW